VDLHRDLAWGAAIHLEKGARETKEERLLLGRLGEKLFLRNLSSFKKGEILVSLMNSSGVYFTW
jgi:hypothetical protein